MKNILPIILLLFSFSLSAQITYEDFEGGSGLTWDGISGTYNGIVANPDPSSVNPSANCGSFTKNAADPWSLAITNTGAGLDLSVNNQFRISIYAPVATQILFKLEGTGGNIEVTKNISNTNVWQEYSFDLSAEAANIGLESIAVFFNPGTVDDGDTYLFDNIRAEPAGPCAGTVVDPDIVDDYECQRNASYGAGWDVIQPVTNPDPTGANTSSTVGQYEDPPGEWDNLMMDYNSAIDLSIKNQFKVKIWSSIAVPVLFKLEGGVSAPYETWTDITQTGMWVEYTADFSSQATADHKKVIIFFNAGVLPTPGDTYFVDDISFGEAPPVPPLEDFENGALLGWQPLNGDMTNHGVFNGVVANPDQTGINDSPNVGQYTKGQAAFSTVTAFLPNGLDLSVNPQLNLHVRAPASPGTVTMQLSSATQGIKEVVRDITAAAEWELLEFNFEDDMAITDFESINLLFDGGTAAPGTSYMFDNLSQGSSTTDPCESVTPIPLIWDDFECQRNIITLGAGLFGDISFLDVIPNPDLNVNTSATVGEYTDEIGQAWNGIGWDSGGPIDLSLYNQLSIKIWSPAAVDVKIKLEGGTSPAVEPDITITNTGVWETYVVDFSDQAAEVHNKLFIFFNPGVEPTEEFVYYIDDIKWTRAPYTDCIANMETTALNLPTWTIFNGGSSAVSTVANPNPDALNSSATCLAFTEAADGDQPWAGFYADLGNYIDFTGDKTIRMKVLMPAQSDITFKLEESQTGANPSGDVTVAATTSGVWEEMVFDYSFTDDNAQYLRVTMIPNILEIPTSDMIYYIDDISIADSDCPSISSVFETPEVESFVIYPNPVHGLLLVENLEQVEQLTIFNLLGQSIQTIQADGNDNLEINTIDFENGIYMLAGYDKNGVLIGNAKFVKE